MPLARCDSKPHISPTRDCLTNSPPGHDRTFNYLKMATSGDLTLEILQTLSKASPILSQEAFPESTFAELKAALDRLASRSMVAYEQIEKDEPVLEPEAEQIVANGSHEARVFEALRQAVEGLSVQDLEKTIGDKNVTKVGQGKAFKEKWIAKTSDGKLKASVSSHRDTCTGPWD